MTKLVFYGTVIQCFLFTVLIAADINAQRKSIDEIYLDIDLKKSTVKKAFKFIEKETGLYFAYSDSAINKNVEINYSAKKASLRNILLHLAKSSNLQFKRVNETINVTTTIENHINVTELITTIIQSREITGKITSAEDNEGLPGVNVIVKGTAQGTVTDVEGSYSLDVPDENTVLVFSSVGFIKEEVTVGNQVVIDMVLIPDLTTLEEIVVVGYGVQKKINLTGSLDVIKEEQISNRAVTNVSSALQGISPNLNISQNGFSTEPGGDLDINIRGLGSLSGNSSPYILVDGVPMDLNSINPSDIESITVLKDASASAIYGARAPYGVILVTTKKGEMNEKATFEYSNNFSFSSPIGLPHMANSLDFANANNQASVNAGSSPWFTDEIIERMRQYQAGEISEETWLLPSGSDWAGNAQGNRIGNGNNDWLHIYYDDVVLRQKHDFSLRGGGKNNSYYISAGYWDQPDELRYGDQFYKRYNVTANLSSQVTDWLRVDFNTKYIKERNQYFNTRQNWNRAIVYHNFFRTNSYRPMYLPNGEFSAASYIPMLQGGKENHYTQSMILSLGAELEPIKNWVTTVRYNYKDIQLRMDSNYETVYGTKPNGEKYVISYPINAFQSRFSGTDYQMVNVVTSYNLEIDGHYLAALAGFEQELNQYNSLWGRRDQILTSNVPSISTATGESQLDDVKSHWATRSYFGRLNYNYKEKYLFEMSARYDGTSRFEKDGRWGFFPSVSAGYSISKENFWSAIEPYVNTLKLRASWGSLGNQNVANYLYLPNMPIKTLLPWIFGNERPNYVNAPGLVSPNLTWETSETQNIGLDASFINNKLVATIDIYKRSTTNMFGPTEALPRTLGADIPRENNATLETRGGEIILLWRDKIGDKLTYSVRAILGDNVSEVTEYNNPTNTLSTWYEGQRIGEIWGLTTVGIYQSDEEADLGPDQSLFYPRWGAGDIHYKDMDGDGVITRGTMTADDAGDYSIIGNSTSRFNYGLTVGATWKGFDFNMFWQGVGKSDYAFKSGDMSFFGFNANKLWDYNIWEQTLDYWRPADETNSLGPNTDAYYTKPYLSREDNKNKQIQTRWTQSAAYLRLKSLVLGYTIPQELTRKVKVGKARLFVSGENLITLTSLTKLIDPEGLNTIRSNTGVGKVHALREVYAVGLNVTF